MAVTVFFPKIGMTMEDGLLGRWLVSDGAEVTKGQPLFEMETEKASMEVEADGEGVLKQFVPAGVILKPGDVVGCLLSPGEEPPRDLLDRVAAQGVVASAAEEPGGPVANTPPPAEAIRSKPLVPAGGGRPARVSPLARRLADEHGIDLSRLTGTGPDGRIVEQDIRNAIEVARAQPPAPVPGATGPVAALPYAGRRRTIGERLHQGLATMAQLTLVSEVPIGEAQKMIHGLNREWRRDGVVMTLTAVIARACALALGEHPRLNSRIEGDQIVPALNVGLGIAVDLEDGVMVPVIHGAEALRLKEVAASVRELTEKAKAGTLTPADMVDGTFTVTSLESTGIDAFTPLINPPQAAILGVGRVREVAVFEGDRMVRSQVTTLSLTFDHRVVDGAPAARFLDRVAELLGRPYLLM
jgi:pyruvate dehydrogenase E2 component (dihydrolipoamide acetyltransferase)